MALSQVTLDDDIQIYGNVSLKTFLVRAPFRQSARNILAHNIANRLPTYQAPRSLDQEDFLRPEITLEQDRCQLHALCLKCCTVFYLSKLLHGSRSRFVKRVERVFLHETLQHLLDAFEIGCHFCSLVLEAQGQPLPPADTPVYLQIVRSYKSGIEFYVVVEPRLGLYKGLLPRYHGTKLTTSPSQGVSTQSSVTLEGTDVL